MPEMIESASKISGVPEDRTCESQIEKEKQVWLGTEIKGSDFPLPQLQ